MTGQRNSEASSAERFDMQPSLGLQIPFTQHPKVSAGQMCAGTGFNGRRRGSRGGHFLGGFDGFLDLPFPHSPRQRIQVVVAQRSLTGQGQPQHFPTQRRRQTGSMGGAQIVAMRFRVGGQRAQYGG